MNDHPNHRTTLYEKKPPTRFAEMTAMQLVTTWGEMCSAANPQEAWAVLRDAIRAEAIADAQPLLDECRRAKEIAEADLSRSRDAHNAAMNNVKWRDEIIDDLANRSAALKEQLRTAEAEVKLSCVGGTITLSPAVCREIVKVANVTGLVMRNTTNG